MRSNDLKSQIFITEGEHSVACGGRNGRSLYLKGRTDKVLPIRAKAAESIVLPQAVGIAVMKIKPFGLKGK